MRVDLSDDSVGVEASKHDVEVARHLKATAESVRDLATTFAGESRNRCNNCGKTRPCRPLLSQDQQGNPILVPMCAPCQEEVAEQTLARARQEAEANQQAEVAEQARRAQAEAAEADDE